MVGDRDSNRGSNHELDQINQGTTRNNNFNQRHKSQAPTRNVQMIRSPDNGGGGFDYKEMLNKKYAKK